MKRLASLLIFFLVLLQNGQAAAQIGQGATQNNTEDCQDKNGKQDGEPPNDPGPSHSVEIIAANDPNDITGPTGYETGQWVSINDQLQYIVRFENSSQIATAPAQKVVITIPIHPGLNGNSLQLGAFGFGGYVFEPPANSITYSTQLDLRDSLGLYVDVTAGLDVINNEVFWRFQSIDPATGLPPVDPMKGFLPVNDSLLRSGEGFISFSLRPKSTLLTGDTVSEQATIVFDINEPVPTNRWPNTIDAFPPASHVDGYIVSRDTIRLHWSGQDDPGGTGIRSYTIYVSENNAPFEIYQSQVPDTTAAFVSVMGKQYRFFSIATDNVGNREPMKAAGEITVTLTNTAPVFTGGTPQSMIFCQDAAAKSLDSMLAVSDTGNAQILTWNVQTAPVYGTLSGFPTASTSGVNVIPAGLSYLPAPRYSGLDSFVIQVSDGFENAAVSVLVTVAPPITNNTISADQIVCIGRTPAQLSGTMPAGGGGGYAYEWQYSTSGASIDFLPVSNAGSSQHYQPAGVSTPIWFRRIVSSISGCSSVSNTVTIDTTTINRWTGVIDSAWSNPANWTCAVPTATTDAIIPPGYPHAPFVDITTAAVRHIRLDSGAVLRFNSASAKLDIHGNITVNGIFDALPGTVGFRGSAAQTMPPGPYTNIIIDGAGLKMLSGNMTVQNQLTLNTGNVALGADSMSIGPSGSISGGSALHILLRTAPAGSFSRASAVPAGSAISISR
jgi:hypothetical protein